MKGVISREANTVGRTVLWDSELARGRCALTDCVEEVLGSLPYQKLFFEQERFPTRTISQINAPV